MELIDTHCHLNFLDKAYLPQAFKNAAEHMVTKMLCVGAGEGTKSAKDAISLAEENSSVWASVGIHPNDASQGETLAEFESTAEHPRVVAIGETGLDFFRDNSRAECQETLLQDSIALAKNSRKPLIIHCRNAEEQTLAILEKCNAKEVGGVFHCYSASLDFAKKLEQVNFLVSFTGILTFKKADALRETVREIPLSRILLETDAPYMAPEPFRGKPSEPMHVYYIAKKIAEIKDISLEEVARETSENAERLFGFS